MIFLTEIIKVGDNKKVHHIDLILSEQLLAVISGRNRHVRLYTMACLDDRDTDFHKLPETKGCQTLVSGTMRHGALTCLCVAMKRQVICYELNKSKTRHRKLREFQVPGQVQWMALQGDKLCVGYQPGFIRYNLLGDGPPINLLHPEDHTLAFIGQLNLDALCAVEISSKELLLCFSSIGVYVDCQGRRSRQQELMWPAMPTACCKCCVHWHHDKSTFSKSLLEVPEQYWQSFVSCRLQCTLLVCVQWKCCGCVWCEHYGMDPDHSSEKGSLFALSYRQVRTEWIIITHCVARSLCFRCTLWIQTDLWTCLG